MRDARCVSIGAFRLHRGAFEYGERGAVEWNQLADPRRRRQAFADFREPARDIGDLGMRGVDADAQLAASLVRLAGEVVANGKQAVKHVALEGDNWWLGTRRVRASRGDDDHRAAARRRAGQHRGPARAQP